MATVRADVEPAPIEVEYNPPARLTGSPYEVLERTDVLSRKPESEMALRQRSGFHQLIVCTGGSGVHDVDFEPVHLRRGTVLRIHPGQVQRFVPEPRFEARMVVWPIESDRAAPDGSTWYPGSGIPTVWQLADEPFSRMLAAIEEMADEQERFEGSTARRALLQSLLTSLLLRLVVDLPGSDPPPTRLPAAYVDFRQAVEARLFERPSVARLASMLGYSTRTLDRACKQVTGQTARQVLDDRTALEIRRLLTHTSRPATRIGSDFGFSDPSNFSKFVKRHTGMLPSEVRNGSSRTVSALRPALG